MHTTTLTTHDGLLHRTALEAARAIKLPRQLPPGHRGYPLEHLSVSSMNTWQLCRETWKNRYILGEKTPPSAAMFVGSRVDDSVSVYYDAQLSGHAMTLDELQATLRTTWDTKLAEENDKHGVDWDETPADIAYRIAREAVEVTYRDLIPKLGRGTATQRRFEFALAPDCQWKIIGYVDLDTIRAQRMFLRADGELLAIQDTGTDEPTVPLPYNEAPEDLRPPLLNKDGDAITYQQALDLVASTTQARAEAEAAGKARKPKIYEIPDVHVGLSRLAGKVVDREVHGIVDYKVKNTPIAQYKADLDPQAGLYLAERALIAGAPQHDFRFAQVAKPAEGKRQSTTWALVSTTRTQAQMAAILTRFAQTAAEITWYYDNVGVDVPWGFAEPGSWKCQAHPTKPGLGRFCSAYGRCPVGAGI